MALIEILAALKGSIALVPPTIKVIEKLKKKEKSPTFTRVVDSFANDTMEATVKLQTTIDEVESTLNKLDFDLSKRIDENQDILKIWNLEKQYYLNRETHKIRAIQKNLRSSINDIGRILMCQGEFENMEDYDEFVNSVNKDINGIEQRPINEILSTYRNWLQEFMNRLRK